MIEITEEGDYYYYIKRYSDDEIEYVDQEGYGWISYLITTDVEIVPKGYQEIME